MCAGSINMPFTPSSYVFFVQIYKNSHICIHLLLFKYNNTFYIFFVCFYVLPCRIYMPYCWFFQLTTTDNDEPYYSLSDNNTFIYTQSNNTVNKRTVGELISIFFPFMVKLYCIFVWALFYKNGLYLSFINWILLQAVTVCFFVWKRKCYRWNLWIFNGGMTCFDNNNKCRGYERHL